MKISFWDNIYSWFVKEATFPENKIMMAMLTMVFIFINKKFPSYQISIYSSQQVWTQIEFCYIFYTFQRETRGQEVNYEWGGDFLAGEGILCEGLERVGCKSDA